jgi:hypothetical protein
MFGAIMIFNFNPFTWIFRSLPSALAYSNFFFLNIFQSIIAVFLATDFMKRDKKMNTSEVLFVRPMSNFEYIAGKAWGLISVFILLNLLVMLLTTVYILISDQIDFTVAPILFYFLMVSIPSLVFIIGLSFVLMGLLRNQPVSFIILLGYIALVLFYLGGKAGFLFDYMVFEMPFSFSGVVGFSDFKNQLTHRAGYLLLGLSFIMFTVWGLNRLPDNKSMSFFPAFLSFVFLGLAIFGFYNFTQNNAGTSENRNEYAGLSTRYFDTPVPNLKSTSIEIDHGQILRAKSVMQLENNTGIELDTLFFSINPGLKVGAVVLNENPVDYEQNNLVVKVALKKAMKPNEEIRISMSYSGIPDFSVCYLDHDFETFNSFDRAMMLRIDKRYGFYSQNYVLLTNESLWYPVPGISYDPSRPAIFRRQFANFDLKVKTSNNLLPVSQGTRSTNDSINYIFNIRDPLPQLTLAIGEYNEHIIDIDGIDVKLNYFKGHDFYKGFFSEIGDTLQDLIIEFLDNYERPLGMVYPYSQFTLLETPVQFSSLPRSWTSTLAQSQPQMVLYPEYGFNVRQADFKSLVRRVRRDSERNNLGLNEKDIQAQVFSGFLNSFLSNEEAGMRFGPATSGTAGNPYSIYPNYYYYVNYISSDECPVLNYAFESYFAKGTDNMRQMFMANRSGIGDNERANLLLREKSLKQIIAETEDKEAVNRVLKAKGAYLLTWMERQVNDPDFEQYLLDFLYDNSYREIKYEDLTSALSRRFNIEFGDFLSEWYTASTLPSFSLGDVVVFETIDKSQAVFVVHTSVSNFSSTDGLVKFTFQLGEGRRGGGGFMGGGFGESEPFEQIYFIGANQTADIQLVLNDSPRSLIFNTLLSENIPSSTMLFWFRTEKLESMEIKEYINTRPREEPKPVKGEIIVDNLDKGFSTYDSALENPVRQFVEKFKETDDTDFVGQGWQAPNTWGKMANSDFYGHIESSAMVVRSGDGGKSATWKAGIDQQGYYTIYAYLNEERSFGPGRGRGRNEPEGKHVYTIYHDDGVEDIELEVRDFSSGWNLIGDFYLSGDTAKVVLSNKGGASRVVADAIKWELQR